MIKGWVKRRLKPQSQDTSPSNENQSKVLKLPGDICKHCLEISCQCDILAPCDFSFVSVFYFCKPYFWKTMKMFCSYFLEWCFTRMYELIHFTTEAFILCTPTTEVIRNKLLALFKTLNSFNLHIYNINHLAVYTYLPPIETWTAISFLLVWWNNARYICW